MSVAVLSKTLFLDSVIQIAHSSKCPEIFSQFSSVQSLSRVRLFATPWIAARQASLWNLTYLQIFFNHWKCKICSCIVVLLFSHSVISDSLGTTWTEPTRPLCPWDFPGKNTVVGCHYLLQGIFLTQGPNPYLLHLLALAGDSLPLSHLETHTLICSDKNLCLIVRKVGKNTQ